MLVPSWSLSGEQLSLVVTDFVNILRDFSFLSKSFLNSYLPFSHLMDHTKLDRRTVVFLNAVLHVEESHLLDIGIG